ncbi:DUF4258 domain-containing protein [Robiginitalea sp. SC105]|uniref:DUF4258 domain-containing protein n=1 Tax=Robiginitalea sp. SC105 TaxID=2762332 RepID=UPI00163A0E5E|nr:DUF4258 domain-containing protein [Robiginitalea sp. SC105]MBC2840622.1 DUF4258 domain-containing protein [Robiginitalea sp. SC105]
MSFLKRFGYYAIGLSVGLLFLAFFLRRKSEETGVEFCYLPNCRVLKALREQPLEVDPEIRARVDTLAVAYLLREGDVEFDLSDPRSEPCGVFVVTGAFEEDLFQLTLERCDSVTRLTRYNSVMED